MPACTASLSQHGCVQVTKLPDLQQLQNKVDNLQLLANLEVHDTRRAALKARLAKEKLLPYAFCNPMWKIEWDCAGVCGALLNTGLMSCQPGCQSLDEAHMKY